MSAVLGALEDCPHAHLSSAARGVFSFSHILTASKEPPHPPSLSSSIRQGGGVRVSHRVSRMRRAHVCEVDDLPRCARGAPRPASDQLMKLRTRLSSTSSRGRGLWLFTRVAIPPSTFSPPLLAGRR